MRPSLPPLVLGATAAAVLSALAGMDAGRRHAPVVATPPVVVGVSGLPAPCAPGTLPEGPVCIRIPSDEADAGIAPAVLRPEDGFERIPRRPDRAADPAAYVYPAGEHHGSDAGPRILEGSDRPGVRLAVTPGEIVHAVALDHQVGPAEVLFVGDVYGPTVVTAHTIEEGKHTRVVLLFQAGLDHAAKGVAAGTKLDAGAEVGAARPSSDAGLIEVYVEAREAREGVKLEGLEGKRLADPATSIATDLRNVLAPKDTK